MSLLSNAVADMINNPDLSVEVVYRSGQNGAVDIVARGIVSTSDELEQFASGTILIGTKNIRVKCSEIPSPQKGEHLKINGQDFKIAHDPEQELGALTWKIRVVKNEQA